MYPVRKLNTGRIVYFNYYLAKEMGLIEPAHPHRMNKELEKILLETFAIRIVNEYDQIQNVKYHPSVLKKNKYMATRYLQLQHRNKLGKTSGDGRSVWNGEIHHNGSTWDISSRGTGVTKLSPGAVLARRPLQSGDESIGYSCGLADIDELIGAAIQAEIFHCSEINTERVLCIIDLGDGNAIGVRAGKNLFRPAHLFMHLKQNNFEALSRAVHYIIERQYKNKVWDFDSKSKDKYDLFLQEIIKRFAHFAAQLDREYVFAWLDWDGDNVLVDAGIIDYGSIRQFGLRHDEYRYDDIERLSTNLNEQARKTRNLVQVFAQMTHYLKTNTKLPLQYFENHKSVLAFDEELQSALLTQFLMQLGLPTKKREDFIRKNRSLAAQLFSSYSMLESVKTRSRRKKVSDGINRPAVFNMRTALYELPSLMLAQWHSKKKIVLPDSKVFFKMILAKSARGKDRKMSQSTQTKINKFLTSYHQTIHYLASANSQRSLLFKMFNHAYAANPPDRMTGNALLYVVDEILKHKSRNHTVQEAVDQLIYEKTRNAPRRHANAKTPASRPRTRNLIYTMLSLVDGHKESI